MKWTASVWGNLQRGHSCLSRMTFILLRQWNKKGPPCWVYFCGVEVVELSNTGSEFCNSVYGEASKNIRIYFVCIKFAKFVHNLIPVYNNLVVQGSGLFYFGIFCVYTLVSFFFLPSLLPFPLPFFLFLFSMWPSYIELQLEGSWIPLLYPQELPVHIAVGDNEDDACSFLLNQQRTFLL